MNEQEKFMESDECLLLSEEDEIIGHSNKYACHKGDGLLHRAFSVLLFDLSEPGNAKLLLQKRSRHKITFPMLWTNTCCSHPLYVPNELDGAEGVKAAAIRKLGHELGISASQVPIKKFHFLTRLRYSAKSDSIWSENEIDYILIFVGKVETKINENEVDSVKYVTKSELFDHVFKEEKDMVTPWFWKIGNMFLSEWWDALNGVKDGESFTEIEEALKPYLDIKTIHRVEG